MRDQFIIRLFKLDSPENVGWVRVSDNNPEPVIEYGALEEAAKQSIGAQVIVLVPTADVLLTSISVPTQNRQRMLKAIPFALEENLASDVEDLHFAIGEKDAEGRTSVAIIERHIMDSCISEFKSAGVNVDVMLPDVFALGVEEGQWDMLIDGQNVLLRLSQAQGLSLEVENLGVMLPLVVKEQTEELPSKIHVWQNEDTSAVIPMLNEDIERVASSCEKGLLEVISHNGIAVNDSINLMQGDYSRREQLGKIWRPWRFAASLAAILFLVHVVIAITESSQLEKESEILKAEKIKIFKQAFPETKKFNSMKRRMENRLAELQQGGGAKRATFMGLMLDSGGALNQTSGLVLRSIRYKNGALDIDLEVPNLQALDQLKQNLLKTKGMSVEIQSAASRNNKVQGRIQIKGQAT